MRTPSTSVVATLFGMGLLAGCFQEYRGDALDLEEVPFNNPHLQSDDAVISAFDPSLSCPDGSSARFFAVYRTGITEKAPVAIVLHSGAFDYVIEPDESGYLNGPHYHNESRLERGWAVQKVWETLGLNPHKVDASEINEGTLPAALTDAGFVQLYPANCWGDLWHNETGSTNNESQYEIESFERNGRVFAYWMIRMIVDGGFAGSQDFTVGGKVPIDKSQVYLVGLGEGGRGVTEMLTYGDVPDFAGVLIDSSPDDLDPIIENEAAYASEIQGYSFIFREENLALTDQWSLHQALADGLVPDRTAFLWSDNDPQQPAATMSGTAEALEAIDGTWVENLGTQQHIFLNGDLDLAHDAIDYLTTGTVPSR